MKVEMDDLEKVLASLDDLPDLDEIDVEVDLNELDQGL